MIRHLLACAALASAAALPAGAASAAGPADSDAMLPAMPSWNAFVETFARLHDYSDTVTAHEIAGSRVEDRTYHVVYARPGMARSEIVAGAGRGSVAVWQGGDTVRGHLGGFLSGIKLTVGIDDRRAVDLRGETITSGYFPLVARDFVRDGTLSEAPGPDGTTVVTFVPRDPAAERGLTREEIVLSDATHLPQEHLGYVNGALVERQRFSNFVLDPPLEPQTFEL